MHEREIRQQERDKADARDREISDSTRERAREREDVRRRQETSDTIIETSDALPRWVKHKQTSKQTLRNGVGQRTNSD